MSLSRKHYKEIARIINLDTYRLDDFLQRDLSRFRYVDLHLLIHDLCHFFKQDNAAFDVAKFYKACTEGETNDIR